MFLYPGEGHQVSCWIYLIREAILPIMQGQHASQQDIQKEGHPPLVKRSKSPSRHCGAVKGQGRMRVVALG